MEPSSFGSGAPVLGPLPELLTLVAPLPELRELEAEPGRGRGAWVQGGGGAVPVSNPAQPCPQAGAPRLTRWGCSQAVSRQHQQTSFLPPSVLRTDHPQHTHRLAAGLSRGCGFCHV